MYKYISTAFIGMAIGSVPGMLAADQTSESLDSRAAEAAHVMKEKMQSAYEQSKAWLALKRDEYQAVVSRKLDDLDAGLERLNRRLEQQAQQTKAGFQEAMSDLREKQEVARAKFSELKEATEDSWEDFKVEVNEAVASLADAYDRAKAEFAPEA